MRLNAIILSIFVVLSVNAKSMTGKLLDKGLFWNIAKLIVASDYDPLLQHKDDPDHGTKSIQKLLDKNVGDEVERRIIQYRSIDSRGDSILLSACLYLPKEGDIKQIIVANHYTICASREAPTENLAFESVFCLKGYAVVMADYIGYGISKNRIHPYLDKKTEAHNVADLVLWLQDNEIQTVTKRRKTSLKLCSRPLLTDSIVMIGYSQGAAVTLATAELIQQQYSDRILLDKLFAGGGPYDPATMYDEWVENDYTAIPFAIPLTILGMNECEDLNLNLAGLFREPLLSNYNDWIISRKYTVNEIAGLMQSHHLSDHMPPEGMDRNIPNTALFYEAMQHQSLLSYKPAVKLYLFHSQDDTWVPCSGSERLKRNIGESARLTADFGHYGNHPIAAIEFYKKIYNNLK